VDIIQKVYNNFDSSFIEKINAISTTQCIAKNNYYLKEGQINKQLAIINTGYLQSFFNKNGDEITTYLAGPGKLAVSLTGYLNQKPSKEYIRAIIDTDLMLPKNDIENLINESEVFRQFYIKKLEYPINCL
jgi:CRP-like cAMP-binding protein